MSTFRRAQPQPRAGTVRVPGPAAAGARVGTTVAPPIPHVGPSATLAAAPGGSAQSSGVMPGTRRWI